MTARRVLLGAASVAMDKLAVIVVQLALVPVLANRWGLELFGIWAMLTTIPVFLSLGDFGIVTAAWARISACVSRKETSQARAALHTSWIATAIIAGLLLGLCVALLLFLPPGLLPSAREFDDVQSRIVVLLLTVYGLQTIVFRLNTIVYRANGRFPLSTWCNTGAYLLENLAMIGAVFFGASPLLAAIILLAARSVSLGTVFIMSFRLFPAVAPGFHGATRDEWAQLWKPALAASLMSFGLIAFLQTSVVVLGAVAGAVAVPVFVAVRTVSRLGLQASLMIALPTAQEFSHAMGRDELFKAGRFFGMLLVTSLVLATGMALGLVVLGQPAIAFWTNGAIIPDHSLLAAMAISSFTAIIWNTLLNLVSAINRHVEVAKANFPITVIGLVVIALAADDLGATAAGIGFAVVDTVTLMAVVWFVYVNWLGEADFRSGIHAAVRDFRSPLAFVRSLTGRAG